MKYYLLFLLLPTITFAQIPKDKFIGNVTVQWLNDGRSMMLKEEFGYIDPNGKQWMVPKNTVVDGASIPQVFWTAIGGPYEGMYRNASVVHDYYCVAKTETWENVHLMFYNACITGGTTVVKAKIMYAAVYAGGPRWKIRLQPGFNGAIKKTVVNIETVAPYDKFKDVTEWIEKTNPSLAEINSKLDVIVIEGHKK